jgi:hypothetical protein
MLLVKKNKNRMARKTDSLSQHNGSTDKRFHEAHGGHGHDVPDFPVLTDVVERAEEIIPVANPSHQEADAAAGPSRILTADNGLSDADVEALAREVFRRVLARLNTKISTDLRDHLTERLSAMIYDTVEAAIADFKQDLADTVGDAIAEVLLQRAENSDSPTQ